MSSRIPAFIAGSVVAALVAGGITYATAAGVGDTNLITKSRTFSGVNIDEGSVDYDLIAAYAKCPKGTQVTGGGFQDLTTDGVTFVSMPDPDGKEAWLAVTIASDGQTVSDFTATVTCMGPSGKFPSGAFRTSVSQAPERLADYARERIPAR
ncbi:hypothetical protein [Nocardioides taihuensis]|uniref:Uncharacterized protein n=1 Tax=Nocardioides taihuensis TaxID=1835606 RepID=A0ABW0BJY1_9ACTN